MRLWFLFFGEGVISFDEEDSFFYVVEFLVVEGVS